MQSTQKSTALTYLNHDDSQVLEGFIGAGKIGFICALNLLFVKWSTANAVPASIIISFVVVLGCSMMRMMRLSIDQARNKAKQNK